MIQIEIQWQASKEAKEAAFNILSSLKIKLIKHSLRVRINEQI